MKIIDILNEMANGTLEDGFEFKYSNETYKYHKANDSIYNCRGDYILGYDYAIDEHLNDEVEIIEETENNNIKEIEELDKISYAEFVYSNNEHRFDLTIKEYDKINELVRVVNKLIKESEEK